MEGGRLSGSRQWLPLEHRTASSSFTVAHFDLETGQGPSTTSKLLPRECTGVLVLPGPWGGSIEAHWHHGASFGYHLPGGIRTTFWY